MSSFSKAFLYNILVTFPFPSYKAKWEDLLKAFMATVEQSRCLSAANTEAVLPFPNFLMGLNLLWKSF